MPITHTNDPEDVPIDRSRREPRAGSGHSIDDPEQLRADVVVCGGGLAGLCAAVAAARHGSEVILVGERPVLGGCSSSEIRVSPQGSAHFHGYARESGILAELVIADRMVNHAETGGTGWTNSVWDLVLYDLAERTRGLTLLLNTTVQGVETAAGDPPVITAVRARTLSAERDWRLAGDLFVDATGDGVVAALAGNEWRMGSEARAELGEPHAPEEASDGVQGTSIQIMTRDMGRPVPFRAPEWAERYDDDRFFHEGGRVPDSTRSGWWWLEVGLPWNTIRDNETIRHELTRRALGVWDWIKNRSPEHRERFANFALDWMGQVPGKRESRRIMGRHLLTEHDLRRQGADAFPDEVAYGGWNIDLHTPGGLLAPISEPTAAEGYRQDGSASVAAHVAPFGIPLRSLIARDVGNLFLAGRDLSATHVALGSVRVQGTTALMGQAVGTAAARLAGGGMLSDGAIPDEIDPELITDLQQTLLRDGAFLPHVRNEDPADLARRAVRVTASSEARNGGLGPEERSFDVDYIGPAEFASGTGGDSAKAGGPEARDELRSGRSQWIAVEAGSGAQGVASVGVWLRNDTDQDAELTVRLQRVDGVWDYTVADGDAPAILRTATLTVPAGGPRWVVWDVALSAQEISGATAGSADGAPERPGEARDTGLRSAYLRLDVDPSPGVSWLRADGVLPGCLAGIRVASDRLQRLDHGVTLCHRVSPAQRVWSGEQVRSGVARPSDGTHQWRSDPVDGMGTGADAPQVELEWDGPVAVGEVVLQWCGHLLRDYDQLPTMRADPETARDYAVEIRDPASGAWVEVVSVTDNVQTHRAHSLAEPAVTDRLRVRVTATNGADYASLYELRVYGEADDV